MSNGQGLAAEKVDTLQSCEAKPPPSAGPSLFHKHLRTSAPKSPQIDAANTGCLKQIGQERSPSTPVGSKMAIQKTVGTLPSNHYLHNHTKASIEHMFLRCLQNRPRMPQERLLCHPRTTNEHPSGPKDAKNMGKGIRSGLLFPFCNVGPR